MKRATRAFTLTELLVVITVLVILIAISVPAFRSLLGNSVRTLAENQLRVGLAAARDAAIRSEGGDTAAVFFYSGNRLRVVACSAVGRVFDTDADRWVEVFAPVRTIEPVQLPSGWSVRGYAPPGSFGQAGAPLAWYEGFAEAFDEGHWVFPETHFVSLEGSGVESRGVQRHTFFVRFRAGDGLLDTSNRRPILVLDPAATSAFRGTAPFAGARSDQATDLAAFTRRALERLNATDATRVFGDRSVDTVLAGPVTELALYDETRMIAAIGGRPNRVTGTLYQAPDATAPYATLDPQSLPAATNQDEALRRISAWIEGRLDVGNGLVESDARVFILQRYLGNLREITP